MNKRRLIFFAIFGVYHLTLFAFTLYLEANKGELSLLYGMLTRITWFKWGALLGVLLWITDVAWWWFEHRAIKKQQESARLENNTLKAQVYDLQQAAKEVAASTPSKNV